MAIHFDFYESPPKEGEDNKLHVHARPVLSKTITTEKLASLLCERSSLTKGDIYSTLIGLGRLMGEKMEEGERVYLEGIGYFSVSLGCDEMVTRKDMRADKVHVKSINFRADMKLKSSVMGAKMVRATHRSHSSRLSNEEIDSRVAEYFKENQVMVRSDLQRICQMKPGMALRQIHRLLEEGKIKNIRSKSQPVYVAL